MVHLAIDESAPFVLDRQPEWTRSVRQRVRYIQPEDSGVEPSGCLDIWNGEAAVRLRDSRHCLVLRRDSVTTGLCHNDRMLSIGDKVTPDQELMSGLAKTVFRLNGQFVSVGEELAGPAGMT